MGEGFFWHEVRGFGDDYVATPTEFSTHVFCWWCACACAKHVRKKPLRGIRNLPSTWQIPSTIQPSSSMLLPSLGCSSRPGISAAGAHWGKMRCLDKGLRHQLSRTVAQKQPQTEPSCRKPTQWLKWRARTPCVPQVDWPSSSSWLAVTPWG